MTRRRRPSDTCLTGSGASRSQGGPTMALLSRSSLPSNPPPPFLARIDVSGGWRAETAQRSERSLGGQYVRITGPMRLPRVTVPHVRESQE